MLRYVNSKVSEATSRHVEEKAVTRLDVYDVRNS